MARELIPADHVYMPMVAESPYGVLDATLAESSLAVPWHRIYRVRPRARLVCRACQRALHAKISKCGLRFFAHDAVNKQCPLTGETLQHRLLKSALAAAVRQCGWHAELEARAADGSWIADVLATSPYGSRQVAWEAQLARQHNDDTLDRTTKYHAGGFEAVWVFDRPTTPQAPHITVEIDDREIGVSRPLMNLDTSRCRNTKRCSRYPELMSPPACPGHGTWQPAQASLDQFTAKVCHDELRWLAVPTMDAPKRGEPGPPQTFAWTCPADVDLARGIYQAQLEADAIATAIARQENEKKARGCFGGLF